MLAKQARLTTKQFENVIKKGVVSHSSLFLLRILTGQKDTRISVAAPKKVANTAVIRNKNRRRLYPAIKPLFPHLSTGVWAILFVKKDISDIDFEVLIQNVREAFIKAKLLKS